MRGAPGGWEVTAMSPVADRILDCRESSVPTVRLAHAMRAAEQGTPFEVLLSSAGQVGEVRAWCAENHHVVGAHEYRGGVHHLLVRRG